LIVRAITGSVIAVIQIADTIISICKDYITTVKDAPKDLRRVAMEVGSIKSVLEVLELSVQTDHSDSSVILEVLRRPDGPFVGCREALSALQSIFPHAECKSKNGKRRKVHLTLKSLAWPLKRERAWKALEDIARHKATISLALTTESMSNQN
jgi:hypothetical protein